MPEVNFVALLAIAAIGLVVIKKTALLDRLRGMPRRRKMQVGGFTVGLISGPAIISTLTAALSGMAAISASNLAGLTDISGQAMFVIGILTIGLYVVGRSRIKEAD
jgi:hypothetical protein